MKKALVLNIINLLLGGVLIREEKEVSASHVNRVERGHIHRCNYVFKIT